MDVCLYIRNLQLDLWQLNFKELTQRGQEVFACYQTHPSSHTLPHQIAATSSRALA